MDEYTRKYGSRTRSSSRPDCYGDVDLYDSADDVCIDCPVKGACRVVVDRKIDQEVRETRLTRRRDKSPSRRKKRRDSEDIDHVPDKERKNPRSGDSFWSALMYNGFLASTKAVLREAHHGVDSIPHMRYPNPFDWDDD